MLGPAPLLAAQLLSGLKGGGGDGDTQAGMGVPLRFSSYSAGTQNPTEYPVLNP